VDEPFRETFVLPPTTPAADYRLRIFTPGGELPFAGHPTLGSAHAWLERGERPTGPDCVRQECGAGLVEVATGPSRDITITADPDATIWVGGHTTTLFHGTAVA
jgi:PhzF family phenazine biosynthesis protein